MWHVSEKEAQQTFSLSSGGTLMMETLNARRVHVKAGYRPNKWRKGHAFMHVQLRLDGNPVATRLEVSFSMRRFATSGLDNKLVFDREFGPLSTDLGAMREHVATLCAERTGLLSSLVFLAYPNNSMPQNADDAWYSIPKRGRSTDFVFRLRATVKVQSALVQDGRCLEELCHFDGPLFQIMPYKQYAKSQPEVPTVRAPQTAGASFDSNFGGQDGLKGVACDAFMQVEEVLPSTSGQSKSDGNDQLPQLFLLLPESKHKEEEEEKEVEKQQPKACPSDPLCPSRDTLHVEFPDGEVAHLVRPSRPDVALYLFAQVNKRSVEGGTVTVEKSQFYDFRKLADVSPLDDLSHPECQRLLGLARDLIRAVCFNVEDFKNYIKRQCHPFRVQFMLPHLRSKLCPPFSANIGESMNLLDSTHNWFTRHFFLFLKKHHERFGSTANTDPAVDLFLLQFLNNTFHEPSQ